MHGTSLPCPTIVQPISVQFLKVPFSTNMFYYYYNKFFISFSKKITGGKNLMSSPTKNRFLFITAVALGMLLNPLNSSMIAVALSRIQNQFSLSFTDASWLISTYYLASGIGQPVMGKLGD